MTMRWAMLSYIKTKKKFQRTVTKELGAKVSIDSKSRMRSKLDRWNLPGIPRVTASRCLEALAVLKRRSPPKIAAAFLRTLWNGWLTGRRFQMFRGCMFRCGEFYHEDSLEHYSSCATIHKFRKTFLSPLQTVDGNAQGCLITMGLHMYALQDDFDRGPGAASTTSAIARTANWCTIQCIPRMRYWSSCSSMLWRPSEVRPWIVCTPIIQGTGLVGILQTCRSCLTLRTCLIAYGVHRFSGSFFVLLFTILGCVGRRVSRQCLGCSAQV